MIYPGPKPDWTTGMRVWEIYSFHGVNSYKSPETNWVRAAPNACVLIQTCSPATSTPVPPLVLYSQSTRNYSVTPPLNASIPTSTPILKTSGNHSFASQTHDSITSRTGDQWFVLGPDAAPTILEKIPSDRSRYPTVSELEGSFRDRFERKERGWYV